MANIYKIISISGFSLAAVFFLVSIVLFFVFRIDKVIGDLSGYSAKKAIKEKQKKAEEDASHAIKAFSYADMKSDTDELKTTQLEQDGNEQTSKLNIVADGSEITSMLVGSKTGAEATEILNTNTTRIEKGDIAVNPSAQYTTILSEDNNYINAIVNTKFEVIEEITFIHTTEYIA